MTLDTLTGESGGSRVTKLLQGRSKKFWWICAAIVLLILIILLARHRATQQAATARLGIAGPTSVGIAHVARGDVPITINALGTVTPLATVTVHPQVTGPLIQIAFKEGQQVKKGDLLAVIDPRPFQAALDQAASQLKRDQATLANAKVDLDRYKTLLAENSVSDQTYATQTATVAQDEATVAADKAATEAAQLNLDYCHIRAPVTGLVGLRQVDIGNLMQANVTTIVVVTQMQPMSVLFTVPEDSLSGILQRLRGGQKLGVDAYDRSLSNKIASGTLANADNEIDPTTGTLKLRALFDNSASELFPSQFVNVRLLLDTLHDVTVVPGAAMLQGSSGSYVYLVNPDSTVSMRTIKVGVTSGDLVSINEGLNVGDTVVVDGADQLRDGAKVLLPGAAGAGPNAQTKGGSSGGGSSGGARHRRQNASSAGGTPPS